jgi:hypothetical protein
MIDSDVKKELDLRLARGSISMVEYKKLLFELDGSDNVVAQYRELKLYEEFIINENEKILLNQIISVDYRHSESQTMVNGIPGPKRLRTDLKVTIKNKKNLELWQASAIVETPHMKALRLFGSALQKLTFSNRLSLFLQELGTQKKILVGESRSLFGNKSIYLLSNMRLKHGDTEILINNAEKDKRHENWLLSSTYRSPYEITIGKLRFEPPINNDIAIHVIMAISSGFNLEYVKNQWHLTKY